MSKPPKLDGIISLGLVVLTVILLVAAFINWSIEDTVQRDRSTPVNIGE
jgi:hypothetical protein